MSTDDVFAVGYHVRRISFFFTGTSRRSSRHPDLLTFAPPPRKPFFP